MKLSTILMLVLIVVAALLSLSDQRLLAGASVVLSILIAFWDFYRSHTAEAQQEIVNDAFAKMLYRAGAGNHYSELINSELDRLGRATDIGPRVQKALQLDPNDHRALLSHCLIGSTLLSRQAGAGEPIPRESVRALRRDCRRGRKLYPRDSGFANSLGILADVEGHHAIARLWFEKGIILDPELAPFFRLLIATSCALAGDHAEELRQVEAAQQEGVSTWLLDFYMGRALMIQGRFSEAIIYLRSARRARPYAIDPAVWLREAHLNAGNMPRALVQQFALAVLTLSQNPVRGISLSLGSLAFATALIVDRIRKGIYLMLRPAVGSHELLTRILHPDTLELHLSSQRTEGGHFKAAESICRAGLRRLPDSMELGVNLSIALLKQGRVSESLEEIDKLLKRFPGDPILRWNREQIASGAAGRKSRIRYVA